MSEKYTEKARRVIFFAQSEAKHLSAQAIEPEHILLALFREGRELFRRLSSINMVEIDTIRSIIEASAVRSESASALIDLPLSFPSKNVLNLAAEESRKLGHSQIGTEHLLLGLIKEDQSLASRILIENGFNAEKVAAQISGGNITPQTKKAETPVVQFLTQLNTLVDLLIDQGIFTREEFYGELAGMYILPDMRATLHSLLDLLIRRGVISKNDKQVIEQESGIRDQESEF